MTQYRDNNIHDLRIIGYSWREVLSDFCGDRGRGCSEEVKRGQIFSNNTVDLRFSLRESGSVISALACLVRLERGGGQRHSSGLAA